MAEETKEETKENKVIKHKCNIVPEFYIYLQNKGEFITAENVDDLKNHLLDIMSEMKEVFGEREELAKLDVKTLLTKYDTEFMNFLGGIKKLVEEKKEIKFDDKYIPFDNYGRIITNYSVIAVPIPEHKCKVVISKSLFYHYLELMAITTKMGILEMSAVFATKSYADGSLMINFDDDVKEEDKKVDFLKAFFMLNVDGITKGLSIQFVSAKEQKEETPEAPAEEKTDEKEEASGDQPPSTSES